jgi:hypothetical protein
MAWLLGVSPCRREFGQGPTLAFICFEDVGERRQLGLFRTAFDAAECTCYPASVTTQFLVLEGALRQHPILPADTCQPKYLDQCKCQG